MYVCHCFGVTEAQVHAHKEAGACTPREVASACKAGTDCGSCVRRIQALLGREPAARCKPSREDLQTRLTPTAKPAPTARSVPVTKPAPVTRPVPAVAAVVGKAVGTVSASVAA
ncbi:(2Fe-2S)-binding protein [Streptomyces sp. PTM05]|uniref:Bacterioferritin-associated ferredoxin n=1 Tax=Streptantibioticus parmotrematis TaxID=2873249 RepID=A0ABS7QV30_9ACTN|nr:(2Fe-2S)-binding protein [Streptantibioticus parmotrematis]MBY8886200.1 (2Fe-2S)-binding protein [Streptantibioticus parmotrematis]